MDNSLREREKMVESQLVRRGITDINVLEAMRKIPRENFLPESARSFAYVDGPVGIGENQTISQPYIVAYMCQELHLTKNSKVMEIGTGSGYETAVLAFCAGEVYTVEFRPNLSLLARRTLAAFRDPSSKVCFSIDEKKRGCVPVPGMQKVDAFPIYFKVGDGHEGWAQHAPYDGIIASACFKEIPGAWISQLKMGGRLVAPIGSESNQNLILMEKTATGVVERFAMPVAFVKAAGEENEQD